MARLVQVCSAFVIALLLISTIPASDQATTILQDLTRIARSADAHDEKCQDNTACGWAIYKPFTRAIMNYIQNTCTCPENMQCIRTDDDLSINAFVYRCRKQES